MTDATTELRLERIGATCVVTGTRLARAKRPQRLLGAASRLALYRLRSYARHAGWTPVGDVTLTTHDDFESRTKTAVADVRAVRLPPDWTLSQPINPSRHGYVTAYRLITETPPL